MRSKPKTNRDLIVRVFPRLAPATYICFEFWLVHFAVCVCCHWLLSWKPPLCLTIVTWGSGYETLPWKQWCCNLCWKGRDPSQSFVLMFTLQLNILTKTFRLVSCSNTFQILLLFVQGQGQRGKQKHTTKKFIMFHNHCLWLTMV